MFSTAVILAGGRGTRIQESFPGIAKPMVPVADKPVLQHIIETYSAQGIERFFITVGHLGSQIQDFFGDGSKWNISIHYVIEDQPLGTAGALSILQSKLSNPFWVIYGDTISSISLKKMRDFHLEKNAQLTLLVHPNDHPYDSDLISYNSNNKITKVHSKPHPAGIEFANCVNAAFYLMNPEIINKIPKNTSSDFGRDLFPNWINMFKMYAYNSTEYIKDMGKSERREEVEKAYLIGKVESRNLSKKQKAIFIDRDGVINHDTDLIKHQDEMNVYKFAGPAIRRINKSEYISIVITNQSVIARGLCDENTLNLIHSRMDKQLGEMGAYIDYLYYCPHHPDGGFPEEIKKFKIKCKCRKPKPGMIIEASKRFNIDLSNSWMIGDSPRDIQSGLSAGVKTIRVDTGHGHIKSDTKPDFKVKNLSHAVDLILNNKN